MRIPSLVRHKPTGLARVRINGRDFYCGQWGTPAAEAKYRELLRRSTEGRLPGLKRRKRGPQPSPDDGAVGRPPVAPLPERPLSVERLAAKYILEHCTHHYRHPDGTPTSELQGVRLALRWLTKCPEGRLPADGFGPKALKVIRQRMIDAGHCRRVINQAIGRIRRMFKWGASEELIRVEVYQALLCVQGLQAGRTEAPDHAPIRPVGWEQVEATLPHLPAPLQTVVMVQWHTGARGGEVLAMRPRDIEQRAAEWGTDWRYRPARHKKSYVGLDREIILSPKAQALLAPIMAIKHPDEFMFSPRESRRQAGVRARYDSNTYGQAIRKACRKAGIKLWSPHQLRHSWATWFRSEAGVENTRVGLGHTSAVVSELYAEADLNKVASILAKLSR